MKPNSAEGTKLIQEARLREEMECVTGNHGKRGTNSDSDPNNSGFNLVTGTNSGDAADGNPNFNLNL